MDGGMPLAAVLMCHAPIVIPAIAGPRQADCSASTAAMARAADLLSACGAETVVVLTPHLPRHPSAFGWMDGVSVRGDFAAFGHPEVGCGFPADGAALAALRRSTGPAAVPLEPTRAPGLDHGATVPLWFLAQAGFRGRVLVLGFPWATDAGVNRRMGGCLVEAMRDLGRAWALLASGDMSHALRPGAPSGYHPQARDFDAAVVAEVRAGRIGAVSALDANLRHLAAEDVVDSLEVAAGVLGEDVSGTEVLSYEGPFGVGYLVARLLGSSA